MTMPGSTKDTLLDERRGAAQPNHRIFDADLGEEPVTMILTDENAISPTADSRDYYYRGDDDDGWYDFNESIFVTDEINITLRSTSSRPPTFP